MDNSELIQLLQNDYYNKLLAEGKRLYWERFNKLQNVSNNNK